MNRKFSADDCVEYMKKKYGREFTFTSPFDKFQPTTYSCEVLVASPDYPGENIYVVEEFTGESIRFRDNFPAVIYEKDVCRLVTELSGEVYGECRVLYSRTPRRTISGEPKTFGEYISLENSLIHFFVILPPGAPVNEKEEKARSLAAALCGKGTVCSFTVYYTPDSGVYDSITTQGNIPKTLHWYRSCGFISTDGSGISSESWR
ncbi:MAG: hypothetical protein IKO47_03720 [Ruminococcus sp.]|nr:hypothetical protein [Ruminococcus sp.]